MRSPKALGLLDLGYTVNTVGRHETTALQEAALHGGGDMCRWLLEHGADRSAIDTRFHATPAGWAAHAGHAELSDELSPT